MELLVPIIITIVVLLIFYDRPRKITLHSNKCHYFDKLQFSTQEFYTLVEQILAERKMPNVSAFRVHYNEASMLSLKREYLRIERKEDIFDICAAPFGTGFFVSYWVGEPRHGVQELLMKIPVINSIVEASQGATYFQIDTASMFKACVKDSIMEAIEQITTTKGVRGLSEGERIAFGA
jgi:hypothetical protein